MDNEIDQSSLVHLPSPTVTNQNQNAINRFDLPSAKPSNRIYFLGLSLQPRVQKAVRETVHLLSKVKNCSFFTDVRASQCPLRHVFGKMATDALVKRVDSAHMKRMYEKALETNDADFLSSTTEVTLEQVRRLKLEGDDKEKALPKVQNKPPQPPKLKHKPSFLLNSFEFFADDDAESWLVETPFDSETTTTTTTSATREVLLNSAPSLVEKRDVVGSPVESNVSSEISRSSCVTPASVLESKLSQGTRSGDASFDGFRIVRPRSVEPGREGPHCPAKKERDIRNLPRSVGSIAHTPAPSLDSKAEPLKSTAKAAGRSGTLTVQVSESENMSSSKKGLGSRLKGRLSSMAQKDSDNKSTSSIPKDRPKSIGPIRRSRVSAASQAPPRPKSSLGRPQVGPKSEKAATRPKKKLASPAPRPKSSLSRPVSSLGTVKEEGGEEKKLLGFRRRTSPVSRPKSSLGGQKTENKASKKTPGLSRIASPAPRPKSALGSAKKNDNGSGSSRAIQSTKPSRIASPSPKLTTSLAGSRVESGTESRRTFGFKKSASVTPATQRGSGTLSSRKDSSSSNSSRIGRGLTKK